MTNNTNTYASRNITRQWRRAIQFFRKIYLSLYLKGFERVTQRFYCERELETEQNCNILTPTLMAITTFLSRSPGLLNRGPGGPASLGAGFLYCILSPTDCTSCAPNYISTFLLWASQIALIQTIHGLGYILIFLDRMHLFFTQMHFLLWQPRRSEVNIQQ